MTQTQQPMPIRTSILSPTVTAAFGFVVYALAMISGEVFDVNSDSHVGTSHRHTIWEAVTDLAPEFAIGLVGVAIAVWAGRWAWLGPSSRLPRTALVLAVMAAITYAAFWAGWSNVFGAVAVGLAVEYRCRVGSLDAASGIALALGAFAFVAATIICALG
jgi:hypothetical protein